jgi:hypothetical protein
LTDYEGARCWNGVFGEVISICRVMDRRGHNQQFFLLVFFFSGGQSNIHNHNAIDVMNCKGIIIAEEGGAIRSKPFFRESQKVKK